MYDTVVVATDGSDSVERAIAVTADLAERFDADLHALYVVDERSFSDAPESMQDDLNEALTGRGEEALAAVEDRAGAIQTAIREGRPAGEIISYAREVDADVVATGTRGRHGEGRLILGSVAEAVVRDCPVPVLTVRQLEGGA